MPVPVAEEEPVPFSTALPPALTAPTALLAGFAGVLLLLLLPPLVALFRSLDAAAAAIDLSARSFGCTTLEKLDETGDATASD